MNPFISQMGKTEAQSGNRTGRLQFLKGSRQKNERSWVEVGVSAKAEVRGSGICAKKACVGRWEAQGRTCTAGVAGPKTTELGVASFQCPQGARGYRKRNPSSQNLGQS